MGFDASLKIGLTTFHLSDKSGGLAFSVPGLAKALSETQQVDCHIVGLHDSREPSGWRRWGTEVQALREVGPHAFGFAPDYLRSLLELAPDLVDAQGLWMYPSLATLRYAERTKAAYLVTPRGMLDPWALERSIAKKRLVAWWFENKRLRRAACLRATAPMEAGHFRAYGLTNPIGKRPVIHAAFSVDAFASLLGRHRHGSNSSILLMW